MPAALTVVIFGASGDLTGRKLIPALFQLHQKGRLPAGTRIVGVARSQLSNDDFRDRLVRRARENEPRLQESAWRTFMETVEYVSADAAVPDGMAPLEHWLSERERQQPADRLYYLSVGPELYPTIATNLGRAGMSRENGGFRRLIIEKPFGHDLA